MFINAKTNLFVIVFLIFTTFSKAQTPSTCFEIESILVDACGIVEGENEMVRFVVGPSNLNVTNLNVTWPNAANTYLGICKNATTAAKVAALNNSIIGCGLLLEPTANILPAKSKVILLSSTDFDVTANSFANLNDTLYVIFQCSGNTAGHFANYNPSGLRTLNMSFSSPGGCSDAVTYDRSQLTDPFGVPMASDGGRVDFTWGGTASYANDGCTAPIELSLVDITTSSPSICAGQTINLNSVTIGNITTIQWNGGHGIFSSPTTNSTNYTASPIDTANFYLYLVGTTFCGEPVKDSILIQISGNNSNVNITSASTVLCSSSNILLTAVGTGNYLWNTGSTASSISISSAGLYYVTSTSSCGSSSDSITISNSPTLNLNLLASDTVICTGNSATLSASGAPNYTWYNGNTGTSEIVNTTGNYYVIGYNNCYSDSQSVFINVESAPNILITSSSASGELCSGGFITLTASGGHNYLWNTSDTSSSIVISSAGNYSVTSTSLCGNSTDNIVITDAPTINLSLSTTDTSICSGNTATLTASGATNYLWFNGNTSTTQIISTTGNYYVIGYNNCYRDSQSVHLTVISAPILSLQSSSTTNTLCNGETITLTATGIGNFFWNTSDTSSTIAVNTAGTYSVALSNSCFSVNNSIIITNETLPIASIMGDSILCNNEIITLTASGGTTYLWSTGNTTASASFSSANNIYVEVSNSCGTDTAFFTIYDYSLNASYSSDYSYGTSIPIEVNFSNSSTNSSSFSWEFGDGSTSNMENPAHLYTSNGEFTVTLTSSNEYCSDTYETTLLFQSPNVVYIPNVFTPNDDSTNEAFLILGDNIATLSCEIFNRWGEKLFSWENVTGFWDGTYKGKIVPDGTYFYLAKITWTDKTEESRTGHVTVLK